MKTLKYIALGVLGLLVLIAVALAVVAWRFDPAWAKQKLVQAVYEQKQRTLKLDGELGLSFYPSLGVRLGKASLSERNSPQEFAAVDGARVSVRLLPLLSRQAVVDRIELDGMRAVVVRGKDGSFNFDDLLAKSKDEKGKDAAPPAKTGQPIEFDIASIAITRSAISYRDDKAGRAIQLSDVNLKTGRLSRGGSGPLDFNFKANAQQPKLNAAFKLSADYRYDVTRRQFSLEKLDLKIKGDALDFKDLDAALSAKDAGVGGGQGGIQVEGLIITAKGRMGDETLDAKVDVPHVALLEERTIGQQANATLRLAGKQRQIDAKLELAAVEGAAAQWKIGKLAAQWSLAQGPLSAKGSIAGPLQTDLQAQIVDLPKLTGELDISHPQMPMKQLKLPLDGSLRADWGKSQATASLSSRFDDSAVQAKLQVTKFSPLSAGFDLAADRLNFDKYFPAETAAAKPTGNSAPSDSKPESKPSPIDFSFLRGLDLKGAMRVGALQARNVKLSNFKADVAVHGGRLDVSPISANLYGGTAAGALSAQADGNRVALRQTFSNIAIGPLIRDYARKDLLEGTGQIALDVTAGGNSAAAMTQSLAGSANLSLHNGAVKGINLAKSVRQAKAMISGKQDAVIGANKAEQTDFSEMTATFKIANGVARNDDLSAKSPYLRAAGAGTIDLVQSRIDYLAKVTIVNTSQGQEGKELADLNGLTVPVRLTGPLDNVSYKLEFGSMAAELAKREAQKQLEKQLDKKGLGGALKGLIR
jgi:AsmA protein